MCDLVKYEKVKTEASVGEHTRKGTGVHIRRCSHVRDPILIYRYQMALASGPY